MEPKIKPAKNASELFALQTDLLAKAQRHEIPLKEFIEFTNGIGKAKSIVQLKIQEYTRLKINEIVPEAQ